ncbi:MAG: hypothetical protein NTX64_15375 [Elusimicrobia bacterium]|nr:hypothetical protein [Elusimicrobiota bacterium]
MKNMGRLGVMAILAVGVFTQARADILNPGERPHPRPRPHARPPVVSMDSESVKITIAENKVRVEGAFVMVNNGGSAGVEMGYPVGQFEDALNDFRVSVDKEEVGGVTDEQPGTAAGKLGPYPERRKRWSVPLDAGQSRTIRVTYWVKPWLRPAKGDDAKGGLLFFSYTLSSGSTWAANIRKATITMDLDGVKPDQVVQRSPAGYTLTRQGKRTTWTMRDFKPTEDIVLAFRPSGR